MLWSSYVLCSLQCLWQVSEQVRRSPLLWYGVELLLTRTQHGHSHCLRHHSAHQLHHILAHAYTMGLKEIRAPDLGLHDHQLRREAVLRLRSRTASQLRPWFLSFRSRDPAVGC